MEYEKEKKQVFLKEDLDVLKKNRLQYLKDWKELKPEQKEKYPDALINILDNISGNLKIYKINLGIKKEEFQTTEEGIEFIKNFITIKSLNQVQKKYKGKFKFIEREEGIKKVEECSIKNYNSYFKAIKEKTISQDIGYVICSGGSGSGKTTASLESLNILQNLSKVKNNIFL